MLVQLDALTNPWNRIFFVGQFYLRQLILQMKNVKSRLRLEMFIQILPDHRRIIWLVGYQVAELCRFRWNQPAASFLLFGHEFLCSIVLLPITMSHTFSFLRIAYITLRQYDQLSSVNFSILLIAPSAIAHRYVTVDTCACVYSPTFPEQRDVHYVTITTTEFRAFH